MTKKTALFILIVGILFLLPVAAGAHQPVIVYGSEPVVIENPEISKAYYDELSGRPRSYKIYTDKEFNLYLNILVPKSINPEGRYSATVYMLGKTARSTIDKIDADSVIWKEFYEKYANDYYYQGPEYRRKLPPGDYEIIVSGNKNIGKYTLVIGEIEKFNPKNGLDTIMAISELKKTFFGKLGANMLFSRIGIIEFSTAMALGFLFGFIYRLINRKLSKTTTDDKKGKNIGRSDRIFRASLAIICLAVGLYTWSILLFFFAGFCFFEAIFSWCGLYAIIGKNTCPMSN